jgi:phage-related protein
MAKGSPGGSEVGRVSVRVVPDTSKFAREAKRELKKISEQLKVNVQAVLDTSRLSEEMKKAKAKAGGQKVKMDVDVDGDGVTREARRIRQIAQKLLGAIKMTVGLNTAASVARIKLQLKAIEKAVQGYRIRLPVELVGLSKWLGILGAVSAILLTIPHLIGAVGGAVNFVGGALALLPALTAAAAFGVGALVVGMKGFFSALGQSGDAVAFEEALKDLAPSAQESARALAEFKEPLSDIRKATQQSLFKGMAEPLRDLKGLLPPVKAGLVGSAAGIRDMVKSWIKMATSQKSVKDLGSIGGNVTKMFQAMRPAAANFGQALRDVTVVGSTFLPKLGTALSNVTGKFAAWATKTRDSGRLEEIIQNMVDKTKQLGRVIADVVVGLQNIFKSMSGGQEFLDMVEDITQGFREWSANKDTQATLGRIANVMRTVAAAAKELFGQAFKSAGEILKDLEPFLLTLATTLGAVVAGAIRAITPMLKSLAHWLSENKAVMVPLIIAIVSMVTAFKLAVTAANAMKKLSDSIDALKAASGIIGNFTTSVVTSMKKVFVAIVSTTRRWLLAAAQWVYSWGIIAIESAKKAATTAAAWVASALRSALFTAKYYAMMVRQAIANFVKMAAAATVNAVKVAAVWVAQTTMMVARVIAQMAIMVAAWVANWVRMSAVAMANAIRIGLAWLIALGPIAILAAAVIALAVLIITNWDNITSFVTRVWNACWKFVSDLITTVAGWIGDRIEWIKGVMRGIGDIVDDVIGFFKNIGKGIKVAWDLVINWVKGVPRRLLDSLGDLGNLLVDAGKAILDGFLRGLKNAWEAVKNFVVGIGNWIADHKGPISYDRKLLVPHGQAIMAGLSEGLETGFRPVQSLVSSFGDKLAASMNGLAIGDAMAGSITSSIPTALASVDKLMDATNTQATADWTAQITAEQMQPMEDRILAALAKGLVVELDGGQVAKSVRINNNLNKRR